MPSTTMRNENPTVEEFAASSRENTTVTTATPAKPSANPAPENGLRSAVSSV
jgi:hypothetical protein